jgi:hypothetical protein
LACLLTLVYPDSILFHKDDLPKDKGSPILPPALNCLDSDSVCGVDFNYHNKILGHIKATAQLPDGYEIWFQDNIQRLEKAKGVSRVLMPSI